ncbi:hypothetical protein [Halobacillus salinus]|uniref:hypothetical protein n=1 Tax=Halobacillus salinus TaxID=192814 RepID=UPI00158FC78D|nr:hypothetical protein [Halobacillus salinus]
MITDVQEKAATHYYNNYCIMGDLNRSDLMEKFINTDFDCDWKPLNDFTPEQFALLLCGWYEVEEPFNVGDWVMHHACKRPEKAVRINDRNELESEYSLDRLSEFRHATPDEIAQEVERRKWAAFGRKVDEYKTGDIVRHKDFNRLLEVTDVNLSTAHITGDFADSEAVADKYWLTLVTPVEQRLDL